MQDGDDAVRRSQFRIKRCLRSSHVFVPQIANHLGVAYAGTSENMRFESGRVAGPGYR